MIIFPTPAFSGSWTVSRSARMEARTRIILSWGPGSRLSHSNLCLCYCFISSPHNNGPGGCGCIEQTVNRREETKIYASLAFLRNPKICGKTDQLLFFLGVKYKLFKLIYVNKNIKYCKYLKPQHICNTEEGMSIKQKEHKVEDETCMVVSNLGRVAIAEQLMMKDFNWILCWWLSFHINRK